MARTRTRRPQHWDGVLGSGDWWTPMPWGRKLLWWIAELVALYAVLTMQDWLPRVLS